MKCLHLHIGSHKTGSTSIQRYFSHFRDYMLRKYGVDYPVNLFPNYPIQHSELRRFALEGDVEGLRDCFSKLAASSSDPDNLQILMSGEDMSALSRKQVNWLVAVARDFFDEINTYLILRDKRAYFLSQIKHQYVYDRKLDVFGFLKTLEFFPNDVVRSWKEAIGEEHVHVIRYDNIKHNLQGEFGRLVTKTQDEFPEPPSRYVNVSIDFMSAMIGEVILKSWGGYQPHKYVGLIREVAQRHPVLPLSRLEAQIGAAFQAHYADDDWPEDLRFKPTGDSHALMSSEELKLLLAFYADLLQSCGTLVEE
ncbi:hypothetical protein Mmar10_2477 [Maricaulis maris MCS10]|jgi:hypothetical protein|uniref:Sulfotransferase family protein n=2 Tax=Maricaulis maris TaxID=74318 RepID=Q0ALS8_MARMM|nr:hypothetical protein Mmar10_2477 [Maricaulis maris MCS10]